MAPVPGTGYEHPSRPRHVSVCRRGSVQQHLRPVAHASVQTDHTPMRFSTREMDFLLLTETWIKPGDDSAFLEHLPPRCSFLSSPRSSGRGGGVATVFRDDFTCKPLCVNNYLHKPLCVSSYSCLERVCPILCAVVYRPPKYSKDSMQEFSEFLAEVVPKYDQLLICGDFNIHLCCPDQMANDFQRLLTSFDLTQSVDGPTHEAQFY